MEKNKMPPHINVDYFEDLTDTIESGAAGEPVVDVGGRIRQLREEKGLTIDELANLTGFNKGCLEQIEKGAVKPQLGILTKLSSALDSAVSRLISSTGSQLYAITRKEERKQVFRAPTPGGEKAHYSYMSLAPEVKGRHMEALIVKLKETSTHAVSVHGGEEFVYVLEGVVSLEIDGERHELQPGDSVYYLSTTPHLIKAKKEEATILAVLYE